MDKKENSSFGRKLGLFCLFFLFIVFVSLGIYLFQKSYGPKEDEQMSYKETGDARYTVYLKDNNFFDKNYIESSNSADMYFVTDLIDYIVFNFDYAYTSNKAISYSVNYKIMAKLLIKDSDSKKVFFEKDYELKTYDELNLANQKAFNLNGSYTLNYAEYDAIAKEFKSQYGVDSVGELYIYFVVDKQSDDVDFATNESQVYSSVPLLKKAIDINLTVGKLDSENTVSVENEGYEIKDKNLFSLAVASGIMSITLFLMIIIVATRFGNRLKNRSNYEKELKKILNSYDRFIGNTTTPPNFKAFEVTKMKSFLELLDIRDNLLRPIMYYEIVPGKECCFYITDDNIVYVYTLVNEKYKNKQK